MKKQGVDKLKIIVKNLNKLLFLTKNETDKDYNSNQEKINKSLSYLKAYLDTFSKDLDSKDIILNLKELLKLNVNFFKSHGDEILDKVWLLYDDKLNSTHNINLHSDPYTFFSDLFLLNNKQIKSILFNEDNFKLDFNSNKLIFPEDNFNERINKILETANDQYFMNGKEGNLLNLEKNFLIDLLILIVFTFGDIKMFYTTVSTFITFIDSKVVLVFKIISLFSLALWQLEKKENFIDSLLFLLAGILRDLARSYLKTKGIVEENLSFHMCTKHVKLNIYFILIE